MQSQKIIEALSTSLLIIVDLLYPPDQASESIVLKHKIKT